MSVSVHLKHGSGLSVRDKFGWLSIEGVDVPYILREAKEKFIPVRVVEGRILSYYPSTYPKEVEERPPLVCHYMKPDEIALLNKCCKQQGVNEQFAGTDPVVRLSDFLDFFGIVKQAYPDVVVGGRPKSPAGAGALPDYGWILIKDALVPYVLRKRSRYVPLNVIRGAAQLLIGVQVSSSCATEAEISCLNEMCRKVGLVFTFHSNTSLIDLVLVLQLCPGCPVQDLPKENPMDFVNAVGSPAEVATSTTISPASSGVVLPTPLVGAIHVTKDDRLDCQQSATRSLQALANMAKNQSKNMAEVSICQDDDDCIMITQAEEPCLKVPKPPVRHALPTSVSSKSSKVHATHTQTTSVITSTATCKESVDSGSKNTSSALKPTKSSSSVVIKPMECFGKTISCLLRGKTKVAYALVEAVCRVYFPTCSLVDFIHFLELEMAVTLYVLKRAEEEAFIQFYGIPTKQLRCNQVIKLQDLKDRMGWLQTRFGSAKSGKATPDGVGQTASATRANSGDQSPTDDRDSVFTESSASSENGLTIDDQQEVTNGDGDVDNSGAVNLDGLSGRTAKVKAATDDQDEQNGKNKNLETTIMRILQDKREASELSESRQASAREEADNIADYYRELSRDAEETAKKANEHQRAPSSNKRKGAPPRKCLVPSDKKMALSADGVKTEAKDTFTEDSDMEEYV